MKNSLFTIIILALLITTKLDAQTLFVPSGTSGIGTSTVTGNVGIGTNAPASLLHFGSCPDNKIITFDQSGRRSAIGTYFSSGTSLSRLDFYISDGTTNGVNNVRMSILGGGNVGIGTNNPLFALDVIKNTTNAILHIGKSNSSGLYFFSDAASTHYNWRISTQTTVDCGFEIARSTSVGSTDWQTPSFVIRNGNVGIGTTNPTAKLHVNQSSNTDWGAIINNGGGQGKGLLVSSACADNTPTFQVQDGYGHILFNILSHGNIGIGTANPGNYLLAVEGTIGAREVKVTTEQPWADFVFKPAYKLRTLGEVEQFIKDNNHLPEIPTEEEVKKDGIGLGEMNAKLLQKVEELTLYLIEQQKVNEKQNQLIQDLEMKMEKINKKQ